MSMEDSTAAHAPSLEVADDSAPESAVLLVESTSAIAARTLRARAPVDYKEPAEVTLASLLPSPTHPLV